MVILLLIAAMTANLGSSSLLKLCLELVAHLAPHVMLGDLLLWVVLLFQMPPVVAVPLIAINATMPRLARPASAPMCCKGLFVKRSVQLVTLQMLVVCVDLVRPAIPSVRLALAAINAPLVHKAMFSSTANVWPAAPVVTMLPLTWIARPALTLRVATALDLPSTNVLHAQLDLCLVRAPVLPLVLLVPLSHLPQIKVAKRVAHIVKHAEMLVNVPHVNPDFSCSLALVCLLVLLVSTPLFLHLFLPCVCLALLLLAHWENTKAKVVQAPMTVYARHAPRAIKPRIDLVDAMECSIPCVSR